jgi:hypothetical protein
MSEEAVRSHRRPITEEVHPAEAQRRLAGQRAKFTMYLRQYRANEDPGFAASAAGYLRWAENNGFTIAGFTKSDAVPEAILRLVDDGPEGEITVACPIVASSMGGVEEAPQSGVGEFGRRSSVAFARINASRHG